MKVSRFIVYGLLLLLGYWLLLSGETKENEKAVEPVVTEVEPSKEVVSNEPVEAVEPPSLSPVKSNAQLLAPKDPFEGRAKYPNIDATFAPFDNEGNRYITRIVQHGKHLVYHGDVLIGETKDLAAMLKKGEIKQGQTRDWPGGRVPFVIDENVRQLEPVQEAIEYLNTFTNLTIVPREEETDYLLFTRGEADCYSYAGCMGGEQPIYLVPQCGVREILHEIMHAVGFFHEQNREDHDLYLNVVWHNIDKDNHVQFLKLPDAFTGLAGRPFDYNSIMLYSSFTFSRDPQEPALLTVDGEIIPPTKNLLSDEDIARVNARYPGE